MSERLVTFIALGAVFGVVALVGLVTTVWLYIAFKVRQRKSGVPPKALRKKKGRLKLAIIVFAAVLIALVIVVFVTPRLLSMPGALEEPGDMKTFPPETAI
jgi:heme/copper-type cytochrome/quinol oxidase subunit 2